MQFANSCIQFTYLCNLPTQTVQKCLYFPYWILREVPIDGVKIKQSMTPTNMPKWTEGSPQGFSPILRTIGNWGKMGTGEVDFTKEDHTNAKQSTLKTYTLVALYGLIRLYLEIHIYICSYVKNKYFCACINNLCF